MTGKYNNDAFMIVSHKWTSTSVANLSFKWGSNPDKLQVMQINADVHMYKNSIKIDWFHCLTRVHTILLLPDSISTPLKFLASGTTCSPTFSPCSNQDRSGKKKYKRVKERAYQLSRNDWILKFQECTIVSANHWQRDCVWHCGSFCNYGLKK
jgi:hypothetical protein